MRGMEAGVMLDVEASEPRQWPAATGLEEDGDALDALATDLVQRRLCDARAVERARRVAGDSGVRFDTVLIQLGLLTERVLAEALARLLGFRMVERSMIPVEPVYPERLKAKFLRKAKCLPLAIEGDRLLLAMADPLDDFTRAAVAAAARRPVETLVALPIELDRALAELYPDDGTGAAGGGGDGSGALVSEDDTERLRDLASEAPVVRLVNQIIALAVETRASDIHLEPYEDRLRLRYRYDGVLHDGDSPPAGLKAAILSRIKIMARLDIAERRLPQDGRLKLAVRGQEIDFRVSTIPSLHGETIVMRVLDKSAVELSYDKLGLPDAIADTLKRLLELPNGMVLVTGPTGSGKTTTLYTALSHLNAEERKIVTVEDPIEYQLGGINQIQVKPQIGLTFATLLRSILRQDPDVIMVGEIRDLETAQIAAQASLTGHLVLSTLHTNSATATVTRLRDMGLEDYLIGAVVKGVLAQRLVRRLCQACARPEEAPPNLIGRWQLDSRTAARPILLWRPVGCHACRGTGYTGRFAVAELLVPNALVERLILGRGDPAALKRAAAEAGMRSLLDAGLDAAVAGITSIEEIMRSVQSEG